MLLSKQALAMDLLVLRTQILICSIPPTHKGGLDLQFFQEYRMASALSLSAFFTRGQREGPGGSEVDDHTVVLDVFKGAGS